VKQILLNFNLFNIIFINKKIGKKLNFKHIKRDTEKIKEILLLFFIEIIIKIIIGIVKIAMLPVKIARDTGLKNKNNIV